MSSKSGSETKRGAKKAVDQELTWSAARLARIKLTDAEVERFTAQLGSVLGYVDQLTLVDVEGVEPMIQPIELETPLREDRAREVNPAESPAMLGPAPDVESQGFKVPSIL